MLRYTARRLLQTIPILLLTSIWVFALLRAIPGDPATVLAGPDATPEMISIIRRDLALDQPIVVQYGVWLGDILRGDLGTSSSSRRPVADLLGNALPATAQLVGVAMAIALVLGVALGIVAAVRRSWPDLLITAASSALVGIPGFWLALLGIIVFALILGWLPPGGRVDPASDPIEGLRTLALPALVLGLGQAAVLARFTRAAMLEVLRDAYIRTAHAKGLAPRVVTVRHALRNALIPIVTVSAIQLGRLLGGAVVIESVFAWPGIGRLVVDAIAQRDYAVVQAVLLVTVAIFVAVNFVADSLYGFVDPRVGRA